MVGIHAASGDTAVGLLHEFLEPILKVLVSAALRRCGNGCVAACRILGRLLLPSGSGIAPRRRSLREGALDGEADFARLEAFLEENHSHFKSFEAKPSTSRRTLYDDLMRTLYHIKWSRR